MATQIQKDEKSCQNIQTSKHNMYKNVLKEVSLTSWDDCNYSLAVKQQAMYAAFTVIPQFKVEKVFQDLTNLFEEQLDVQSELFEFEEKFQAELLCKTHFPIHELEAPKSKRARNDGDFDETCSMVSDSSSKRSKSKKTVKIKREEGSEPLESYVADFVTGHHENIKFYNISETINKATIAKIIHADCTETYTSKTVYEKSITKVLENANFMEKLIQLLEQDQFLDFQYAVPVAHIILNICCGAEKIMKIITEKNIHKLIIKIIGVSKPNNQNQFPEKTRVRMKAKTALIWALCELASTSTTKNQITQDVDVLFKSLAAAYLEFQIAEETDGLYWIVQLILNTINSSRINNDQFKKLLNHQETVYGDFNLLYHIFDFCIGRTDGSDRILRWEAFLNNDYLVTAIEQVYYGDQEQEMSVDLHEKRKTTILDSLATASSLADDFEHQKTKDNLAYLCGNVIDLSLVENNAKEFKQMLHIIDQIAVSQPSSVGNDQVKIIVKKIGSGKNPDADLFNLMFEIIRSISIRNDANTHCLVQFGVFEAILKVHKHWIIPANNKQTTSQKRVLELSLEFIHDYLLKNSPVKEIQEIVDTMKRLQEHLQPKIRESLLPKILGILDKKNKNLVASIFDFESAK